MNKIKSILAFVALMLCGGVWAEATADENGITPTLWYTFDENASPAINHGSYTATESVDVSSGTFEQVSEMDYAWKMGSSVIDLKTPINSNNSANVYPTTYIATINLNGGIYQNAVVWGTNGQAFTGPSLVVNGSPSAGYTISVYKHQGSSFDANRIHVTYSVPEEKITGYHQYAVTIGARENNANLTTLYVDGVYAGSAAIEYQTSQNGMTRLGRGGNGYEKVATGLLYSDFRFYQLVLTVPQIAKIAGAETVTISSAEFDATSQGGVGGYRPIAMRIAATDDLPAGTVLRVTNVRFALENSDSGKPATIALDGTSSNTAVVGDSISVGNTGITAYACDYAFGDGVEVRVGEEYYMSTPNNTTGRFRLLSTTDSSCGAIFFSDSMGSWRPYYVITADVVSKPAAEDYTAKVIALNFYSNQGSCSGDEDSGALDVAIPGKGWNNLGDDNAFPCSSIVEYNQSTKSVSSAIAGLSVSLTRANGGGNYQWTSATPAFLKGYIDDNGEHATVAVSGIPYSAYDVYVYYATDSNNTQFSPAVINGKMYTWNALVHDSCNTPTAEGFGRTQYKMPILGVNVQKISSLSGDLTVTNTGSNSGNRGGIAAIVIVESTAKTGVAPDAMSIKVAVRTDSDVRSAAFAGDAFVGAYPVPGSYWQNTASKNSNNGAYGEYLQLTDGKGKSAKFAMYIGNNWYSTTPGYKNGNCRITRANVDCNNNFGPIAANTEKSFSGLTMNGGALTGAGDITLPAMAFQRNWQARISEIPYDSYDLYFIVANGSENASNMSPMAVKVGNREIKYYKGNSGKTVETSSRTDSWNAKGFTTDGTLTEATHYLRVRVTKTSAEEDISTVDFAPANGKFTIGAIQIVKAPNRVVTNSFSFNSFTIEGTTSTTTLADGDTVIVPSNCSGDEWGCDVSSINSYVTEIGKSMNWKKPVKKNMTIGSGVVVYFYSGASIEDGVTISGGEVSLNNGNIPINGVVEITSEVVGSNFRLDAETATLTVSSKLADDKVTSGVSGKVVDYDSSTKTYSLIDPSSAKIVIGGTTRYFATLSEAITAANAVAAKDNKVTVTLLANSSDAISIDEYVTVDTGAFTVSGKITGSGTIIFTNKWPGTGVPRSGLTNSDEWTGVLWFKNMNWQNFDLAEFGNARSTVRLTGVTGHSPNSNDGSKGFDGTVEFVDEGDLPGLKVNADWNSTYYFNKVAGAGTFQTVDEHASKARFAMKDVSKFTGTLSLAGHKGVVIGDVTDGDSYGTQAAKLVINANKTANIAYGKTWTAATGITVNGTIKGSGTLGSNTTFGDGATIDLTDGALTASGTVTFGNTLNVTGSNLAVETIVLNVANFTGNLPALSGDWALKCADGAIKLAAPAVKITRGENSYNFATIANAIAAAQTLGSETITLEFHTTESFASDSGLISYMKTAPSNVTFKFVGSGDTGVTLDFGSANSTINSHVIFAGGTHTYKWKNDDRRWAAGGTYDNPNLVVEDSTTLNFVGHDIAGWAGSNTDGVLRVKKGGTINFSKYGTGTTYFTQVLALDPGSTMNVTSDMDNSGFRIWGEADANMIVVAASAEGDSEADRTATINVDTTKFAIPDNGAGVLGVNVGANSILKIVGTVKAAGAAGRQINKRGPGNIVFTGAVEPQFNLIEGSATFEKVPSSFGTINGALTIADATATSIDMTTATLGESGTIDLSGCTALTTITIPDAGRDASANIPGITLPAQQLTQIRGYRETNEEYALGSFRVANASGMTIKVLRPGVAAIATATVGEDGVAKLSDFGEIKIAGGATNFDLTFNGNTRIDYTSVGGSVDLEGTASYKADNQAISLSNRPWVDGAGSFFDANQLSLAMAGVMPEGNNQIFMHIGSAISGYYGVYLATGTKNNEVIIGWNEGNTGHLIDTMVVPNARSKRHCYIITKNDVTVGDETTATFTIYLDGLKWKTFVPDEYFRVSGGFQVGSCYGRMVSGFTAADDDTSYVNFFRAYQRIITQAEIDAYADAYPYTSPNGTYTRDIAENDDWVSADAWTSGETMAEKPALNGNVVVTATHAEEVEATAKTITVNLEDAVEYEKLTLSGDPMIFTRESNTSKPIKSVCTVIGTTVTLGEGAIDLTSGPTIMADGGKLKFDFSGLPASAVRAEHNGVMTEKLTGEIDRLSDDKIAIIAPTDGGIKSAELVYKQNHYEVVIRNRAAMIAGAPNQYFDTVAAAITEASAITDVRVLDDTNVLPEGYENYGIAADGSIVAAVAKAGGSGFASLATAAAYCEEGDVIELLANDTSTVALNKNITIKVSTGEKTVSGVISGNYSITKVGEGMLRLGGANTFVGLNVNEGTVKGVAAATPSATPFGSLAGTITIEDGAVLDICQATLGNADANNGNGYTIISNGGNITKTSHNNDNAYSKLIKSLTLNKDMTISGETVGVGVKSSDVQCSIALNGHTLTVEMSEAWNNSNGKGNFYLYNVEVSGSGTIDMKKGNLLIHSVDSTASNAKLILGSTSSIETEHAFSVKELEIKGGWNNKNTAPALNVSTKLTVDVNAALTLAAKVTPAATCEWVVKEGTTLSVSGNRTTQGISGGGTLVNTSGTITAKNKTGGYAIDGMTIQIDGGSVTVTMGVTGAFPTAPNDPSIRDTKFIIGNGGALTNSGWLNMAGTIEFDTDYTKSIFASSSFRGEPKIIKSGTGALTFTQAKASDYDSKLTSLTLNGGTFTTRTTDFPVLETISGVEHMTVAYDSATKTYSLVDSVPSVASVTIDGVTTGYPTIEAAIEAAAAADGAVITLTEGAAAPAGFTKLEGGVLKACDYVVISPNAYVEAWQTYVTARQTMPAAEGLVLGVKNAAEIYDAYPYASANDNGDPRNAAESIHKWIGIMQKLGTKYFVLGGVWMDARNISESDKDTVIPGITAYPIKPSASSIMNDRPSDLYYACHFLANEQKYVWDPSGDGVYVGFHETNPDIMTDPRHFQPTCVVSRMAFWPGFDGSSKTYADLIAAYKDKLVRGEAYDFAGNGYYLTWVDRAIAYRDDGMPDAYDVMADRLHAIVNQRTANELLQIAVTKNLTAEELASKKVPLLTRNWEIAMPFGHGTPEGAAGLYGSDYVSNTGLTKLFMANVPCFTGYLGAGDATLAHCALSNPNGGALVSINNTGYGYTTEIGLTERYVGVSEEMLDYTLDAYVAGATAGEAWRTAISDFAGNVLDPTTMADKLEARGYDGTDATYRIDNKCFVYAAIVEEELFGDPLVAINERDVYAKDNTFATFRTSKDSENEVAAANLRPTDRIAFDKAIFTTGANAIKLDNTNLSGHRLYFVPSEVSNKAVWTTASDVVADQQILVGKNTTLQLKEETVLQNGSIISGEGVVTVSGDSTVSINGLVQIYTDIGYKSSYIFVLGAKDSVLKVKAKLLDDTLGPGYDPATRTTITAMCNDFGFAGATYTAAIEGDVPESMKEIVVPEGATALALLPSQTADLSAITVNQDFIDAVKVQIPNLYEGGMIDLTSYFTKTVENNILSLQLKETAKPAETDMTVSMPGNDIKITVQNPIPGLCYSIVAADSADGFVDEQGVEKMDLDESERKQVMPYYGLTPSAPLTYTYDPAKKVQYFKVRVSPSANYGK